jgi:hypothetical protein
MPRPVWRLSGVLLCYLALGSVASRAVVRARLPTPPVRARCSGAVVMLSKDEADAESNERLVAALFGGVEEELKAIEKDRDTPSHQQLDVDDEGRPLLMRFVYVSSRGRRPDPFLAGPNDQPFASRRRWTSRRALAARSALTWRARPFT